MSVEKVVEGVYRVPLGFVNAFLIQDEGLTFIDTGTPGNVDKLVSAVRELGFQAGDVKTILITHLHTDHTGSLSALKNATGARVGMHPAEAELIRQGFAGRASQPPPGWMGMIMKPLLQGRVGKSRVEPVEVDFTIQDGEVLHGCGDVQAILTPGHTAGHLAFLYPKQGGVLFAGDTLTSWLNIGGSPIYEDYGIAMKSLEKLLPLNYGAICFSHGKPLVGKASEVVSKKIRKMIG